jgi:hypothetical protein
MGLVFEDPVIHPDENFGFRILRREIWAIVSVRVALDLERTLHGGTAGTDAGEQRGNSGQVRGFSSVGVPELQDATAPVDHGRLARSRQVERRTLLSKALVLARNSKAQVYV